MLYNFETNYYLKVPQKKETHCYRILQFQFVVKEEKEIFSKLFQKHSDSTRNVVCEYE